MKTTIVVSMLVALTAPLHAQMVFRTTGGPGGIGGSGEALDRAPSAYGVSGWKVGEWARYSLQTAMGGPSGMTMQSFRTVSVVGEQDGKFWVEVDEETVSPMQMRSPVRQLLVPFGAVVESAMSEMLVLRTDSSIMRSTVVRAPKVTTPPAPFPAGWEKVGEETLQIRPGSFKTVHYKKGAQELWVSAAAGPIGVVRFKTDQVTVELVAQEKTGAKSQINAGGGE